MDVSVVMGTDQRSVDRHVSLRVWANFGVEDALVLRQPGEPITADEQTPFRAFETRTSGVGQRASGCRDLHRSRRHDHGTGQRNPSLLDRASYQIAIWGIDLPFTTLSTTPPMSLH